jgi:hypothetical protein
MTTTARIGGVALLCGLAFWLGREAGGSGLERLESGLAALGQRMDAQARARGTECVGAVAALANNPGVSPQQIEEAIARGLAAERPAGAAAPAADPQPIEPPPSAQAQAALERGRAVLASAAAQRRWTSTEAEAFGSALPDLDPTTRRALMLELSRAINNEEFQLEVVGPPF